MSLAALGISAGGALLQHGLNQRAQKKAFQQNVDFWKQRFDETNKYNSPVQQVARLKDAGLNPALLYGGSATGAAGQAGSQSADGAKAAQSQGFTQLGLMSAQADQIKAQTELARQDKALRAIQASTELSKAAKTKSEARTAQQLAETSKDLFEAQLTQEQNKAVQSFMSTEIMTKTKKDEINSVISDARYKAAKAKNEENANEIYEETRKKLVSMGIDPQIALSLLSILKR